MQRDSTFCGAIDQPLMQQSAANPVTYAAGETGLDFARSVDKADPSKGRGMSGVNLNAQRGQRRQAIGHDAFAASLVDGRLRAIDDGDLEACLPGSDCGRESGGASTGN